MSASHRHVEFQELANLQRTLARAFVDANYRRELVADSNAGAGVVGGPRFPEDGCGGLSVINWVQVSDFAALLTRKRQSDAFRLMPWSVSCLSTNAVVLFGNFATIQPPRGGNKPLEDALAFQKWLLESNESHTGLVIWQKEVIRFENASIQVASGRKACVLRYFRLRVHEWESIASVRPLVPPKIGRTIGMWWRGDGFGGFARFWRLPG